MIDGKRLGMRIRESRHGYWIEGISTARQIFLRGPWIWVDRLA
jgi:hypothetical protein